MDVEAYFAKVLVILICFAGTKVNAQLIVSKHDFSATGEEFGLSIMLEFSGVPNLTCIIDGNDDLDINAEVTALEIPEVSPPPLEATFTTSGYFDISLACFGEDDFFKKYEENFYIGNKITEIGVGDNSSGLAVPYNILLSGNLSYEVSFLTGSDVDITFELLHNGWKNVINSTQNGTHTIDIPRINFPAAGIYTISTNFSNPLEPSGITKYVVLALQAPVSDVIVTLNEASSSDPTYILTEQDFSVKMEVANGDNLTFSLTVVGDDDSIVALKGSTCTGNIKSHSVMYKFISTGLYNLTVDITNYVSSYTEVIPVSVIHKVNEFSVEVSSSNVLYDETVTFTVKVEDTAKLPMGTVTCGIDYDDGSSFETINFDMTSSDFISLPKTTGDFTHDFIARWYDTNVTCSSQLPAVVNSTSTTMTFQNRVKVFNPVENLILTSDSKNSSYHPFSESITFTLKLANPSSDLPLANLTCNFTFASSGNEEIENVKGDVTSSSTITLKKSLAGGKETSVSAYCKNLLSDMEISPQTFTVYFDCWMNGYYFDAVYKTFDGALTSKTNKDMKITASLLLTNTCNGTLKHFWTIHNVGGTFEVHKNVSTSSAAILNLAKYEMNETTYKISLTTLYDEYPDPPILTDFVYVNYTYPPLLISLKVDDAETDMKTVWRNKSVKLDSSASSDPAALSSSVLTMSWECKTGNLSETDVLTFMGSNFSTWPDSLNDCSDIMPGETKNFTIEPNTLVKNYWYLFVLTVEDSNTNRSAKKAQALKGIPEEPLKLEFRCQTNCFKGPTMDKLALIDLQLNVAVLTTEIQNNSKDIHYSWNVSMLDSSSNVYVDKTDQLDNYVLNGTGLTFPKDVMIQLGGQQYLISCTVKAPNYAITTQTQQFVMNLAPYGGTCSFSVSNGTTVQASITDLNFKCSGWKDEYDNPVKSEADDGGALKYGIVRQYLTDADEVNTSIPEDVSVYKASVSQSFKALRPNNADGVIKARFFVRVADEYGPPYRDFLLGDLMVEPAVAKDASGQKGVEALDKVLGSNSIEFESAVGTADIASLANVITTMVNALPTETPEETEIQPSAGGYFTGNDENGEPLSADTVLKSFGKKEDDPTTAKCKNMTAMFVGTLLATSKNQSNETLKDPSSQKGVMQAVTQISGQKNNINEEAMDGIKRIVDGLFDNLKDAQDDTGETDAEMVTMSGSVSHAFTPSEREGTEDDVSLEGERERSKADAVFASDKIKEDVENGSMSEDEMIFFRAKLMARQKQDAVDRTSRCNSYSKKRNEYQTSFVNKSKFSDGGTKQINGTDSSVIVTKDTSENLANRTLKSAKSSANIPGLAKLGQKKAKLAIFEDKSVTHLDNDQKSGAITSGESKLIIDTDDEAIQHLGTVTVVQQVEKASKTTVSVSADPDDASGFIMYLLTDVKREDDTLNINLVPDPDSDVTKFIVYILHIANIDDVGTVSVSKVAYDAKAEVTAPKWNAAFSVKERGKKKGIYSVAVEKEVAEDQTGGATRKKRSAGNSTGTTLSYATATMSCMTWDDSTDTWRTDECDGTWDPDIGELHCECTPKKELTFANSFYVAPNKIDFSSVFLKFSPLNQAAVMATLLLIFLIYIIIIIWARRQDRKDLLKWGITPLSDNFSEDNYFYVIKVFTGMRPGAGTRSRVCMVIAGEEMDSGVRELADGVREEFATGSVMNFLMSTNVYLGDLDYIRLWHDNSGKGSDASWYLSKIEIHDVQRNESFTFLGERWLAVEKEDGMLECVLPVCKTENFNVFKNRFFLNAKDNLAESHIWISVAYRPQASNFTRTQRASCALLFIMLTMISNAMFFRSSNEEDNFETPSELQVGPFRFSLHQIYISFVCALIVTPGTLIVIYLFKLSKTKVDPNETLYKPKGKANRYKIPFMDNWLEKEQKRSMELEQHVVQKGIPNNEGFSLPQWCVRLAWFIILATTFLCAFFIMLFSMQWGKQKSEEWITTFLLSFFESVFCLDPVKVGIMALVFAVIFRSAKESQAPVNRSTIMKKYSSSLRGKSGGLRLAAPPLDEKKLEKARSSRQRDLLMKKALRDIIVNVIIIWILFSISFSNRDVKSYYMHQEVVNRLLEPDNMPSFSAIRTTSDFFDWLNNTAIINAFPENEKDGSDTPLHWRVRQFVEGGTLFRVGPPRLRQLRTTKKSCKNSPFPTVDCFKKYYEATEETGSYCIGWKDGPCDPDEKLYQFSSEAWRFTSAFDIWGMPISGYYTTYGGGGYIADLSVNRQVSQKILNELFNNSWVDRQTRAVLLEFTLYCLNANIFTYNMFMVEFPETGGAFPYFVVFPMRVYLHQGAIGAYTLACEVLFVVYLIILTVMVIVQIVQQKKDFFKQGWQVYELIFIILSYLAIIMNIVQVIFTNMSLDVFREDKKAFVNFYHLAIWNTVLVLLIGVLVFMSTVRMLNILGYNKRIHAVANVFTKAASDLVWFGIFFSFVFTCYAAFGYLLFGWKLTSYKNIYKTMGTLFISMIGKSRFTEIEETDPIFSKIYFMCFIFFVVYMILTMFLAVLSKAIDQVHAETKTDKGDEMVDFVLKKIKGLTSYGSKTKKGAVNPAPWNRETTAWGRKRRAFAFDKATNREILQEIRESMQQALAGNPRDFSTPVSDHNRRHVTFRH